MPFSLIQTIKPSHEPISLDEMKDFLRIDSTDQDGVIPGLISTARRRIERFLAKGLINQQFSLQFDRTPGSWPFSYGFGASLLSPYREIKLPRSPLVSIDEFSYQDMNTGDPVVMVEGTDYQVSGKEPGRLQPAYGQAWPIARWTLESIKIKFTVGYGDATASPAITEEVPDDYLTAIKLTVGHIYENRESQEIPTAALDLIRDERMFDFAPVMNNWERWAR